MKKLVVILVVVLGFIKISAQQSLHKTFSVRVDTVLYQMEIDMKKEPCLYTKGDYRLFSGEIRQKMKAYRLSSYWVDDTQEMDPLEKDQKKQGFLEYCYEDLSKVSRKTFYRIDKTTQQVIQIIVVETVGPEKMILKLYITKDF